MSSLSARFAASLAASVGAVGAVALTAMPAHASEPEPPAKCFRTNNLGEPPTCTWNGRSWEVSYDSFGDPPVPGVGAAAGTAFGVVFLLVLVLGIGVAIWRVSLARKMATESGMDPGRATAMTLLSDDGLDATYIASSLRNPQQPPPASVEAPTPRSVEERLRELQGLRDAGLVSAEEYESRRSAILDTL